MNFSVDVDYVNGTSEIDIRKPKLILHFDARNTIFVADLNSRITTEKALNTYIAGVVWGTYNDNGHWKCETELPLLRPPVKGQISIYKHLEKLIVKVPEDRGRLRELLGNFTQTEEGKCFRSYFVKHLEMLKWRHCSSQHYDQNLITVRNGADLVYHYLLPSFLNLIIHLSKQGREFCIIVRTFGKDGPYILRAINELVQGRHPLCEEKLDLTVNFDIERFKRFDEHSFEYECKIGDEKMVLSSPTDVYEHWNKLVGIHAVVDDFDFWQKNNYNYAASKLLWFRPEDFHVQHILFDDNIRSDDDDDILNLCQLDNFDGKDFAKSLTHAETEPYDFIYYVQTDLLDSIANKNYFIETVEKCEKQFAGHMKKVLKQHHLKNNVYNGKKEH